FFSRSIGHRVHQRVQLTVALAELGEELVNFRIVRDVALEGLRVGKIGDEIAGLLREALVLVSDGQLRAGLLQFLRYSPGDAALVGDSEDDRDPSFQAD